MLNIYLIVNNFKLCKLNINGLVDNLNGLSSEDRIISIIKVQLTGTHAN